MRCGRPGAPPAYFEAKITLRREIELDQAAVPVGPSVVVKFG
jgi:hypothetical protein